MNERRIFRPRGACAILPSALGVDYGQASRFADDVSTVEICGPLEQHAGGWFDSYAEISARFDAALATGRVTLLIDSPGGVVSGCFDLARAMRAKADACGARVEAYVSGCAASAAYALACVADRITVSPEAIVGSVGVVDTVYDLTAANAMQGLAVAVVTSGARKADGNPDTPISDGSVAAAQTIVDDLAAGFFAWVAERRGIAPEAVAGLQAAVYTGRQALGVGLVDAIGTVKDLFAVAADNKQESKAVNKDEMIAALRKMADDGDEQAKKALAAFEDEEEPKAEDEEEPKAEDEEKPKDDEDAKALALRAISELARYKAAVAAEKELAERSALIGGRADLDAKTKAFLSKQPLAVVREFVATLPEQKVSPVRAARAALGAQALQGDDRPALMSVDAELALDRAMGLAKAGNGNVKREGVRLILGGN